MPDIRICTPKTIQVGPGDHVTAGFMINKLWKSNNPLFAHKNNTITIGFLNNPPDGFDPHQSGNPVNMDPLQDVITEHLRRGGYTYKDAIKEIVEKRIKPLVSMNIQFIADVSAAMIKIKFTAGEGSSSYIGTDCLIQSVTDYTMNFSWFDVPTVIHEFGHAMGMIHEHQNPRGRGIPWNEKEVYIYFEGEPNNWSRDLVYQNIIKKYDSDQVNGSDFDQDSIMLYAYPASLTENNCCGTKQNSRLSETDIRWLRREYPQDDRMSEDEFFDHITKLFVDNINYKQDCVVNPWGYWDSCSETCGGGTQTRSRTVETPASGGGAACPVLKENQSCNTAPCVTCKTGPWGPWGSCSASCGGGAKTRSRTVEKPAKGSLCSEKREEKEDCNTNPCSKIAHLIRIIARLATDYNAPSTDGARGSAESRPAKINPKLVISIMFLVVLLVVLVIYLFYN